MNEVEFHVQFLFFLILFQMFERKYEEFMIISTYLSTASFLLFSFFGNVDIASERQMKTNLKMLA